MSRERRNFGISDESEQYLILDWLKCIIEEFKEEENNIEWPVRLLDRESRNALWSLAELFNSNAYSNGIGGQACRIFERYLAVKCKSLIYSMLNEVYEDVVTQWDTFKNNFLKKIILYIVSSIQLASKMSHSGVQISIKSVRNKLMSVGIRYSQAEIRESEFEVFKTLGFRLPMWSSLETAELFAKKVNLYCDKLFVVVNFVEMSRIDIEEHVRDLVKVNSFSGTPALRTLHLSAACVAVCARIMAIDDKDIVEQLTTLTSAPPLFIKCISDIIVKLICNGENDNETDTDKSDELDIEEQTDDHSGDEDKAEQMDDNSCDDDKREQMKYDNSDDGKGQKVEYNDDNNNKGEQTDVYSDDESD